MESAGGWRIVLSLVAPVSREFDQVIANSLQLEHVISLFGSEAQKVVTVVAEEEGFADFG
jgi:hypothetical protein